ncbi:MAG: hypothetical protein RMJ13_06035 [Elusimicrobiota bacterium]|nr:hypothetical protein [Elusimicrobiota bacterium]
MKKFVLLTILVIAAGIGGWYYFFKLKRQQRSPEVIKIKLPTGEVVDAYRIRFSTRIPVPERAMMIVKGVVNWEKQEIHPKAQPLEQVVLTTDTGQKFVLSNPPYVNTLIFNAIGKKVKLKAVTMGKTSFKDYEGLWIEDILEIE